MTSAMPATSPGRPRTAAPWQLKSMGDWDNGEVRAFLEAALPGHPFAAAGFRHTTGRVLSSMSKEDLRHHARNDEIVNVIWAELARLQQRRAEREAIEAVGVQSQMLYVRTPAEVCVELEVRACDTIADVKERLAALEGTPVEQQRLTRNGGPLLDTRTLASYSIQDGAMILLVPRLSVGGQRYVPPHGVASVVRGLGPTCAAGAGGLRTGGGCSAASTSLGPVSGIPRPRVPVVCTDIARPFPMHLEFEGVPEYQSFMLALQRQAGRHNTAASDGAEGRPYLEVLQLDDLHERVQTRITFDTQAEVLLIDSLGDVLMECARYKVMLHLRSEQKHALLVTGIRHER